MSGIRGAGKLWRNVLLLGPQVPVPPHNIIIEFWWDARSLVDPNILNLDPDPGLYYQFWKKKLNQCIFKNFNNKMTPKKNQNFLLIWVSELWIYIWNITSFAFILSYIYPFQFLTFYWWVKILLLVFNEILFPEFFKIVNTF